MLEAMGDNLIKQFLDDIQSRIGDWFSSWLPSLVITEWIVAYVLFFAALVVVGYFLPWKIVRATLGGLLLIAGAFLAGGITMAREFKAMHDKDRQRIKELERQRKQAQPRQGWPW